MIVALFDVSLVKAKPLEEILFKASNMKSPSVILEQSIREPMITGQN